MKHRILVADTLAEEGLAALSAREDVALEIAVGLNEAALTERLRDCHALLVRSATKVTAGALSQADQLMVIGRAGIGVDNIDVEAATERGVVVLNTPDANATTTAELALAHMFSLSRALPQADRSVRAGEWKRSTFVGSELSGKTVGVIGFGTIGRIFADRCQCLKMRVIAHDPFVTREIFEQSGVESMELDAMLAQADYVSIHCPLTKGTRHLIDVRRLALMKSDARLINCARGGLVDEQALHAALSEGRLAGAALDVFETEPPAKSPLLALNDIVFTPHLGASTEEAQVKVGVEIARQVLHFLSTGEAVNAVNLPRVPGAHLEALKPYLSLARKLGRLLALMAPAPISAVEVALHGRAAIHPVQPVASEALVGLLSEVLSGPVNRVNAPQLARRQGIALVETQSADSVHYQSLLTVTGRFGQDSLCFAGTLFDERHPRLVRINRHEFEVDLQGHLLFTRHEDRPGVIGAIGTLLGREQINIQHMEVGSMSGGTMALAVIGISHLLPTKALTDLKAISGMDQVLQVTMNPA